jgi:predicted P-loop ATPase
MPHEALNPRDLLARYQALGFRLIYWARRGDDPKLWKGPHEKGWNDPAREYPLDAYDPDVHNLGLITGTEVSPGRFVADVDLDWADGLPLATKFLPPTRFAFGRKGKKLSHAIFTTSERVEWIKYFDFADDNTGSGEGTCFVELRGGNFTHQTMIAPSLHSKGTRIELVLNGEPLHVESLVLRNAVLDYAIACLLLKRVPGGLHHDGRVALTGFLLRASLTPERVTAIQEAVCAVQASNRVPDMSSKDVADVQLVVRTTLQRLDAGRKIEGGPKFAEFIGGNVGRFVLEKLNSWLGRGEDFARDNNGRIIPKNQENIRRSITLLNHHLSYNEFADKLLMDDKLLEDPQWIPLCLEIERAHGYQPPVDYFQMVIKDLCWRNRFHPVREYLNRLEWDQQPRVDEWLIHAGRAADTPYVRAVSAIMLIAAVRRIRHPGSKYDEMVVWESPQGQNKSSAAAALCHDPDWFSDDLRLNLHAQQLIEATLGKWIIEASDLAGKRKTEIEQLKAMLSRRVDGPARMAYAHFPVERPRHFILIGTTNSSTYLTDQTGSRRFWPISVGRFDVAWIQRHRDQLWAEASVREAAGESIRLPEDLWPDADYEQEQRREMDPWESIIRSYLISISPSGDGHRRTSTSDIWAKLGIPAERRDRHAQLRISEIMQRFGFERTRVRKDGELQVGFAQVEDGRLALRDDDDVDVISADPPDKNTQF